MSGSSLVVVLVKQNVLVSHESHYAGGKHAFACLAKTLAEAGHQVHVLSVSTQGQVLHHLLCTGSLSMMQQDSQVQGLVSWTQHDGIRHVVSLKDQAGAASSHAGSRGSMTAQTKALPLPLKRLQLAVQTIIDSCRHSSRDDASTHSSSSGAEQRSVSGDGAGGGASSSNGACDHSSGHAATGNASCSGRRWLVIMDADETQHAVGPCPCACSQPPGSCLLRLGKSAVAAGAPAGQAPQGGGGGHDHCRCMRACNVIRSAGAGACSDSTGGSAGGSASAVGSNADGSGGGSSGGGGGHGSGAGGGCEPSTLMTALSAVCGRRLLMLVQNVHHLPFGPCGTARRDPAQQAAWNDVGAVLCVSRFVAAYVGEHGGQAGVRVLAMPALLAALRCFGEPPFEDWGARRAGRWRFAPLAGAGGGGSCGGDARGLGGGCHGAGGGHSGDGTSQHLVALGAGRGQNSRTKLPGGAVHSDVHSDCREARDNCRDVQDMEPSACCGGGSAGPLSSDGDQASSSGGGGAAAATGSDPVRGSDLVGGSCDGGGGNIAGEQLHASCTPATRPPVVAMLKMTPEKGADVFLGLAARLPQLRFLAVCADSGIAARACQLPNVRIMPPQRDLDAVLRQAALVVAPSAIHEAFGMVVVDAMLRGLPVVVSDAGGLPEAGLGVARVVRQRLTSFPRLACGAVAQPAAACDATPELGEQPVVAPVIAVAAKHTTATSGEACGGAAMGAVRAMAACAAAAAGLPKPVSAPPPPPSACSCRRPSWLHRQLPQPSPAELVAWEEAITQLFSSQAAYLQASAAARARALHFVGQGADEARRQLLQCLQQLAE